MIKRVVIAGCRDYNNYDEAKAYIDCCLCDIIEDNEIVIVSGGACGADALGERYAKEKGFKLENTLPIGKNTVGVRVRKEMRKWQKFATV